jgi:hypothetical protein
MDQDELYQLTMTTISRALDGDIEGSANALMEIGQTGDTANVYGACCAFAEVAKAAMLKLYGGHAPNLASGDMWALEQLKPGLGDPAEAFAMRFIVAYANDDPGQTMALFQTTLNAGPDDHVSSVSQLLATAVSLSHTAHAQGAGQ